MFSSTTTSAATHGVTTSSTYISIPISLADVISRSIHNLSIFLSSTRPWPEFFSASDSLDFPSSFSAISKRIRLNSKYFSVNYVIVISTCAALSLIGVPLYLVIVGVVFSKWLILYFFREDPIIILGQNICNLAVLLGLVLGSVATVWLTRTLCNILIGIGIGLLVSTIHAFSKNSDGLFLDEDDAVLDGLVSPNPGPSLHIYNNGGIP